MPARAPLARQLPRAEVVTFPEPDWARRHERLAALIKPGIPVLHARVARWLRDALGSRPALRPRAPDPAARAALCLAAGGFRHALRHRLARRRAADACGVPGRGRVGALVHPAARRSTRCVFAIDPWLRRSYARAALVLGVAPYMREVLAAVPMRRFEPFLGIGVEDLAPEVARQDEPGRLALLHVGRAVRTKGLRDAVRALARSRDLPGVTLTSIGGGEEIAICRAEAARLGLADRVRFLGRLPRAEIEAHYRASDAFVFPSFRESMGGVLYEAMRWGLPVVTVDCGGPGWIVDECCGLKVPLTSPETMPGDLARAIRRLALDPGCAGGSARAHGPRSPPRRSGRPRQSACWRSMPRPSRRSGMTSATCARPGGGCLRDRTGGRRAVLDQGRPAGRGPAAASEQPPAGRRIAAAGQAGPRLPLVTAVMQRGRPGLVALFLLSMLPQISFKIGPLAMKPYRIFLLVLFVPLLLRLLSGAAGRMLAVDWLMIGATLWAALALMANHPLGDTIQPIGVLFLELLGAYMVARVCIRSAEDFRTAVKIMFVMTLILLPFAMIESVTRRPILLQLLGQSGAAVDAGIRMGLRRAQTVFAHPIHYGAFVSAGLGLAWYALKPGADLSRRIACALVIGLSTFFSLSAGALLAFTVQCGLIAWEMATAPNPRRWRLFAWGCLAGYFALDLVTTKSPFHTLVHYATFSASSGYNRILIWKYGTDNILAHPIFGIGLNDWERPGWMSSSVDNFWLLITMQYGLPFLAMFAGALLLILRRLSRQELADPLDRACRAGYLTTVGGIVIAGGTVHYWSTMFAFVVFVFGMGVWMIAGGAKPAGADPGPRDGLVSAHGAAGAAGGSRRKRTVL